MYTYMLTASFKAASAILATGPAGMENVTRFTFAGNKNIISHVNKLAIRFWYSIQALFLMISIYIRYMPSLNEYLVRV